MGCVKWEDAGKWWGNTIDTYCTYVLHAYMRTYIHTYIPKGVVILRIFSTSYCAQLILGWSQLHGRFMAYKWSLRITYKKGPPNYCKWIYPYSYTHLQPWLNRVWWGYNYLMTGRGAPSCTSLGIILQVEKSHHFFGILLFLSTRPWWNLALMSWVWRLTTGWITTWYPGVGNVGGKP